jgi:Resolvase, N terminal domain
VSYSLFLAYTFERTVLHRSASYLLRGRPPSPPSGNHHYTRKYGIPTWRFPEGESRQHWTGLGCCSVLWSLAGKAMFQMLGVFAEFERSIIQERVRAGLLRAKREGKFLRRERALEIQESLAKRASPQVQFPPSPTQEELHAAKDAAAQQLHDEWSRQREERIRRGDEWLRNLTGRPAGNTSWPGSNTGW